jgi:hypothetical protein
MLDEKAMLKINMCETTSLYLIKNVRIVRCELLASDDNYAALPQIPELLRFYTLFLVERRLFVNVT